MVSPMVKVSIISLVYQSAALADWVYESVHKHTPMIARGEAEFFFVANDPTPQLLNHLRNKGYQHVVNVNRVYDEDEMFANGYGGPEYMSRVYRGYNEGVRRAKGDYVVLINSDNSFSPDWLENLLKYSDRARVISSTLVEYGHPVHGVSSRAVLSDFGSSPETYDEDGFLAHANHIRRTGLQDGGIYMPALFHRDVFIEAGCYPCGNIAGKSFDDVVRYGDEAFFDTLRSLGVRHSTALDSIAYHLKEGELDDCADTEGVSDLPLVTAAEFGETLITAYPVPVMISQVNDPMVPTKRHTELLGFISGDEDYKAAEREARRVEARERKKAAPTRRRATIRRSVEMFAGKRLTAWVLHVTYPMRSKRGRR